MEIRQRNYSNQDDQREMIRLAQQFPDEVLHGSDLPYRLSSWALDEPENVGLWVDENDRLVAWTVMQTPFWTIDYVVYPEVERELHPLILNWVDRRVQASVRTLYWHPAWYVNVFADQQERRQELEQNGYVSQAQAGEDSWSKVWMERSGKTSVPGYPLPASFTIRSLAGVSEVEAYVELHQAVFKTKNMTSEWRSRTLKQLDYLPDLDVVVVAPDGRLAAFCIGWLSKSPDGGLRGQIEPLGCHADFRKYALGRVVLCETLRRLQEHGAERIFVETDSYRNTAFHLYENVGFGVIRDVMVYRKDYNHPTG